MPRTRKNDTKIVSERTRVREAFGGEDLTGSKKKQPFPWSILHYGTSRFTNIKFMTSQRLYTAIDEIICNARDHYYRFPNDVRGISIKFNRKTGEISIQNDGPGIPLYESFMWYDLKTNTPRHVRRDDMEEEHHAMLKRGNGRIVWNPEIIMNCPRSGQNFDKVEDHIAGGVNGIGMKLTVYLSRYMKVTTVSEVKDDDGSIRKVRYEQDIENPAEIKADPIIHLPTITDVDLSIKTFTSFRFTLDYELLGHAGGYNYDEHGLMVFSFLETRAFQIAASCSQCTVKFRDQVVPINGFVDLAKMNRITDVRLPNASNIDMEQEFKGDVSICKKDPILCRHTLAVPTNDQMKYWYGKIVKKNKGKSDDDHSNQCVVTRLKYKTEDVDRQDLYAWDVAVVCSRGTFSHMSIVNGLYTREGGSHIKFLMGKIIDKLLPLFFVDVYGTKFVGKSGKSILGEGNVKTSKVATFSKLIESQITLVMNGMVNGPSFDSQCKQKISTPVSTYLYDVPSDFIRSIWAIVRDYVIEAWLDKHSGRSKSNTMAKHVDLHGYRPARWAGKKRRAETFLVVCEGNSAQSQIDQVITSKKTIFNPDNTGTWSIKGVPVNVRRNKLEIKKRDGSILTTPSEKLKNNIKWIEFLKITGLNIEEKYKNPSDLTKLRYGHIILCTDQDYDGKGCIRGITISNIAAYWPHLFKHNYIKALNTSIIRVKEKVSAGKNIVHRFRSVPHYEAFAKKHEVNGALPSNFKVEYCKGLASSSLPAFIADMDEDRIGENLETYSWDEKASQTLEDYYGKLTGPRKRILSQPFDKNLAMHNRTESTVTEFLNSDAREHQQESIGRRIIRIDDGLLPSWRKFIWVLMNDSRGGKHKVAQYASYISSKVPYFHGETSLQEVIFHLGCEWWQKNVLPFALGSSVSNFGTKGMNGTDHGQPRYTFFRANKKLLSAVFINLDRYLLKLTRDDDQDGEPVTLQPIIPMALLKYVHLPAHAYKTLVYPRDPFQIIDIMVDMIEKGIVQPDVKMIPRLHPYTGHGTNTIKVMLADDKELDIATYEINSKKTEVLINRLPIQIMSAYLAYGSKSSEATSAKDAAKRRKANVKKKDVSKKIKRQQESKRWADDDSDHDIERNVMNMVDEGEKKESKDSGGNSNNALKNRDGVVYVRDSSSASTNSTAIEVTFAPGVLDNILASKKDSNKKIYPFPPMQSTYQDSKDDDAKTTIINRNEAKHERVDPFIEYFSLRRLRVPQLNFIDNKNIVNIFESYEEYFAIWYARRIKLYKKRKLRIQMINEYRITMLEEQNRYSLTFDLAEIRNQPEDVMETKLSESDPPFRKIDKKYVDGKKHVNNRQLAELIYGADASYKYLLLMNAYNMGKQAIKKRNEEIEKLKKELIDLESNPMEKLFPGASMFHAELINLREILHRGLSEGWSYDQPRDVFTS
jgi:DNA gyrase/topoisomerase IV subunit B